MVRNACPIHSNFQRLQTALLSRGIGFNITKSCRAASALAMCDHPDVVSLDPLTWRYDCATGVCPSCPTLPLDVHDGVDLTTPLTYTQWMKGPSGRTAIPGNINSLFQVTKPLHTAMEILQEQVIGLKQHIFVAYNQWRAKKLAETNLGCDTLMLVEDYQQNLTVELAETTTSTVFGANVVQIAEFPAVVFFRMEEGGPVHKASITFFSDDLCHDHQQVQAFEKRIVEIVKEKTGLSFHHLVRFSDGCGAQFKSRFCVDDLCQMPDKVLHCSENNDCRVQAHYFASHEGKSDSDTAGSLEKLRAERVILRNKNLVITNAAQLVDAISAAAPEDSSTAKYSFRVIEEMPVLDRLASNLRPSIPIKGIMQMHFLGLEDGSLKIKKISCLDCLQMGRECEKCRELPPFKSPQQLHDSLSLFLSDHADGKEDDDGEDMSDIEAVVPEFLDEETDSEEESAEEEEEDECDGGITEGCFVWAPFGRRMFPAQIVSLATVPVNLHHQLKTNQSGHVVVKWVGEVDHRGDSVNRFSPFPIQKLELLGESASDHSLAKRCPMKYYEALNQALTPSYKWKSFWKITLFCLYQLIQLQSLLKIENLLKN